MWLLIPILIYCIIFYYTRHVHTHWRRMGMPSEKTTLTPNFLQRLYKREFNLTPAITDAYELSRERFVGIYLFFRPILLVRDITLAKEILDNPERCFQEVHWNYMHPIKKMFYFEKIKLALKRDMYGDLLRWIEKVGDNMLEHFMDTWTRQQIVSMSFDIEQIIQIYTNDVIAKLFYGLEVNSFKTPFNIFIQEFASFRQNRPLKKFTSRNKLGEILQQSINQREQECAPQPDLLQILLQVRNSQYLRSSEEASSWNLDVVSEREKSFTIDATSKLIEELTALLRESITNTAVLTIFEVSQQPAILRKVLKEIEVMSAMHELMKNELTMNAIQELVYVDLCIKETLRMYPPVPLIKRLCNRNYRLSESRHSLDAGFNVLVPVQELQRDEKYFAEPLLYQPERFLTLNERKWSSAYIPFGRGAKADIAETLTILAVKVSLTKLLLNFDVEPASQSTNAVAAKTTTKKLHLKRKKISLKV